MRNRHIKAKVVRIGNWWQVLTKEDDRIRRLGTLGGFMRWEIPYNTMDDVEKALKNVWGFTVVKSFK